MPWDTFKQDNYRTVGGDGGSARYEPELLPPCLTIRVLNTEAGRPGLPPLKCIGHSNNNTAANSGLSTWGFELSEIRDPSTPFLSKF